MSIQILQKVTSMCIGDGNNTEKMSNMNNSTFKVGILGTGAFAQVHAEALSTISDVELVAACDLAIDKGENFTKQWGGVSCGNIDEFLSHDLDIVAIATPDETHLEMGQQILSHSKAPRLVIMEKPLCMTTDQLDLLEKAISSTSCHLVVDHSRRFSQGYERIKSLIQSGELGMLRNGHWRYYAGWLHNGVHIVDTLRMLFEEFKCISAETVGVDRYSEDPLLNVVLQSESMPNAEVYIEGIPEDPYQLFEAELFFERGRIRIQWDDIFIDGLGEEYAGARPMEFREHFTVDSPMQTLQSLYTLSTAFLQSGNTDLIDRAGFSVARGTMDILFAARSLAKL